VGKVEGIWKAGKSKVAIHRARETREIKTAGGILVKDLPVWCPVIPTCPCKRFPIQAKVELALPDLGPSVG